MQSSFLYPFYSTSTEELLSLVSSPQGSKSNNYTSNRRRRRSNINEGTMPPTVVQLPPNHMRIHTAATMMIITAFLVPSFTISYCEAVSDFKLTTTTAGSISAANSQCATDFGNTYYLATPNTGDENGLARIAGGGGTHYLGGLAADARWYINYGPDKGRVFWINVNIGYINKRYHKYTDTATVTNGAALVMDTAGDWKTGTVTSMYGICQRMPCTDVCGVNIEYLPDPLAYYPNCNCRCKPGWKGARCDILFTLTCESAAIFSSSTTLTQTIYNNMCKVEGGYLAAPQGEADREAILSLGKLSATGPYALTGGVQNAAAGILKWYWMDGPFKGVYYSNNGGGALNGQSVFWHSSQPNGGAGETGMILWNGYVANNFNIVWSDDNLQSGSLKCYVCQFEPGGTNTQSAPKTRSKESSTTLTASQNTNTDTSSYPKTSTRSLPSTSSFSQSLAPTASQSESTSIQPPPTLTPTTTFTPTASNTQSHTSTMSHTVSGSATHTQSISNSHSLTSSTSDSTTLSTTITHSTPPTSSWSSTHTVWLTTSITSSPITHSSTKSSSASTTKHANSITPSATKSIIPLCTDVVTLTACPQSPLATQTPGLLLTTGNLSTRIFDSSSSATSPTISRCDGDYVSLTGSHSFGTWSSGQAALLHVPALTHPLLRPITARGQLRTVVYGASGLLPLSDVHITQIDNVTGMMTLSVAFRGSKRLTGLTVDIALPVSAALNCQAPNGTSEVYLAYRVVLEESRKIVDVQAVTDAISTPAVGAAVLGGMPGGIIRAGMLSSLSSLIRCSPTDLTAELSLLSNALGIGMGGPEGHYQRGSLVSGAVIIVAVSALLIAVTVPAKMIILRREHRLEVEVGIPDSATTRPPPTWRDAVSYVYLPSALFSPIAVASEGWVPSGVTLVTMPAAERRDILGGAVVLGLIAAELFHVLYVTAWRPPVAPVVLVYPGDEARRARGVPSTKDGLRRTVLRLLFLPRSGIVARPDLRLPGPRPITSRTRNPADSRNSWSSSDSGSDGEDVEMGSNYSSSSDDSTSSRAVALVAVPKDLKGVAAKLPVYRADEVAAVVTRGGIDVLVSHSKEGQTVAHWLLRYSRYSEDSYRLWLLGFEFLIGTAINVVDGFVSDACLEKAIATFVLAAAMLGVLVFLRPFSVGCQQVLCLALYGILVTTALMAVINAVAANPMIDDVASVLLTIGAAVVVLQAVLNLVVSLAEAQSALHLTAAGIRRGTQRARNAIRFIHFGGDITPLEERADREEQEVEGGDVLEGPVSDERSYIKGLLKRVRNIDAAKRRQPDDTYPLQQEEWESRSAPASNSSSSSLLSEEANSDELNEIDSVILHHEQQRQDRPTNQNGYYGDDVDETNGHYVTPAADGVFVSFTSYDSEDAMEIDALIALQQHQRQEML